MGIPVLYLFLVLLLLIFLRRFPHRIGGFYTFLLGYGALWPVCCLQLLSQTLFVCDWDAFCDAASLFCVGCCYGVTFALPVYIYMYVYVCVCMRVCMYMFIEVGVCMCSYVYIYVYVWMYVNMYIYVSIRKCVCMCRYTHIKLHTHTLACI